MFAFSYIEINTCCVLLLALVLKVHLRSLNKNTAARVFTALICAMIVYIGFDFLCGMIENDAMPTNQLLSSILNVGFFWSASIVTYLSFAYAEYEMGSLWLADKRSRLFSLVPLAIILLLTVLTLKFRFFFYIDEQGNYIKGPFYVPVLVLAYGYLLLVWPSMLRRLRQKQYYLQRKKVLTMASFVVFPLISGAIQAMYTGISIICMGGTIAILQVFINMQETRVTLDPLTHMNNRTHLMQVLETYMADKDRALYFLMMDIDGFKDINDRYGHLEGDEALIALSHVLMRVCGKSGGVLARYGGDEFAVVLLPEPQDEDGAVERFEQQLSQALYEFNELYGKPYRIDISVGSAKRSEELDTIPALIDAADAAMYRAKRRRKSGK